MIYEYRCDECSLLWNVRKPVIDIDNVEHCISGHVGTRLMSASGLIFNSDSFPSQAMRGKKFWQKDGRNMYFKENEFLQKESADDAMAAPDTCLTVAKRGDSVQLFGET